MKTDLTQGKILDHIKNIAIPASIGLIFNTLYNVVDTYYSGKIGTDSMAGLAVSFPIFFIIIALSVGIGSGTTALLSISIGNKNFSKFHSLIKNSLLLSLVIALALVISAPFFIDHLFKLSGAEGNTLIEGVKYMDTLYYGALFFILNFVLNGVLSSQGDTRSFRNALIFGFFLNLILDPIFIYGWLFFPKLGTVGIALATVIIQFFNTIYLSYKVFKSPLFNYGQFKESKFSLGRVKDLLKQGIPTSLDTSTIALGVYIINYFVFKYSNSATMAAYGAAMRIEQMALLPAMGLNSATLTITGQNYGAKLIDRVYELRKKALIIGITIMVIGGLIIYPFAPDLIGVFSDDPEVIDAGTLYLRIEIWAFPTYVILGILLAIMQGIKKPLFGVFIGLYRQILMPIPLFLLLGSVLELGVVGLWWGIVFLTWSAVFITYLYSRSKLRFLKEAVDRESLSLD